MLRGATFDNQVVKANYDGSYFAYQYGDGALLGCTVSNTATAITIQAGILLVSGRIIANDEALTINLTDPITNGFLRMVLQIDLNKLATQTEFEQVEILQQYKATQAEFADLTKENINLNGKIYQMAIGVYQITNQQIVSTVSTFGAVQTKADLAHGLATTAKNTADAAMPLAGGVFTGRAKVPTSNYSGFTLRNATIVDSGWKGLSRNDLVFME